MVQPGRFAQGPDEKFGVDGRREGLAMFVPLSATRPVRARSRGAS
jgi:hypothetical protein